MLFKRTFLSMAVASTFILTNGTASAKNFSSGLELENQTQTLSESSTVNGSLQMTASNLNLDGAIELKVEGVVNETGSIWIDEDSKLIGEHAKLVIGGYGTEGGHEYALSFINWGHVEVSELQAECTVANLGTLVLHDATQMGVLENGGTIITDTGVLDLSGGSSVATNFGTIQSATGRT